jgi:hypothetical protein
MPGDNPCPHRIPQRSPGRPEDSVIAKALQLCSHKNQDGSSRFLILADFSPDGKRQAQQTKRGKQARKAAMGG